MRPFPTGRINGGTGTLTGPIPNTQFKRVIDFLIMYLPEFSENVSKTNIYNENGLNSRLSRFITNAAKQKQEVFFAEKEIMEDETCGNSPRVDIGIYLYVDDIGIDPPLITVFEGKRLTNQLQKNRRREYVIGYEEKGKHIACGGIERFKLGIHGAKLKKNCAGMIGYIQDGTAENWQQKINTWIGDLSTQFYDPAWSIQEQLKHQKNNERLSEYSSIVNRAKSELYLTHLWIDLSPGVQN
jgi:hypothetical protein